ncbi:RNA polymerase sigma-70 factor [Daejeonella sp. H1SJ63]|jgi:RNA polymerase sigma-70 factor (ECF subfamily)|uniref:RNA polymerase sigma factor n=1 Tax=Daejeonella sp. H1SJ63 TaxID=3034145 RepID=UPI0023ECC625|nr:RNA polymerase sigma-70 factor [Daejeonella sp. H1SJ63]
MATYAAYSDIELLDLLRSGDKAAFSEIYNRYWKKIFTVAANKIGQLEEAEEIVQEIFISMWNRRESIFITTSLNAYLAVSVKYRVIKVLAKRNLYNKFADHSLSILPQSDNSTQDWLEFEELKSRLAVLVTQLPDKCRLVYKLSREEGMSQKQIAEEFGISEKTVEAHIGKALKHLRTGLGQIFL